MSELIRRIKQSLRPGPEAYIVSTLGLKKGLTILISKGNRVVKKTLLQYIDLIEHGLYVAPAWIRTLIFNPTLNYSSTHSID